MDQSSEALDGIPGNLDHTLTSQVVRLNGQSNSRNKRQELFSNDEFAYPRYRYGAAPSYMFYPRYHRDGHFYDDQDDPSKPRIKVHVETVKRGTISHVERADNKKKRRKRQLFGVTSVISPIQPIEGPLNSQSSQERLKSFVQSKNPKSRVARANMIEVPIRAEEHHGVVNNRNEIAEENGVKKSTIQRIQKRVADDLDHAEVTVKRQYVLNSEPEIVRATVKGSPSASNNPIGSLIKLIAGQNSKNILGLNSKSFDVFPGPLPTGSDKSVWNIKSNEADAGPERPMSSFMQPDQERLTDLYSKAGIRMEEENQRRAEAAKEANIEAMREQAKEEAEKQAIEAKQAEFVARQAAVAAQERKLEEERELEKEREFLNEEELERERASQLAYLMASRRQQQAREINQNMIANEEARRPIDDMPEQSLRESPSEYEQSVARGNYIPPSTTSGIMTNRVRLPLAGYALQKENNLASIVSMPRIRPTMTQFVPTPTMFFIPRAPYIPFRDESDSLLSEHVRSPLYARTNEMIPSDALHYQHRMHNIPHHESRYHLPTESPYRSGATGFPDEDDDDEKPEVHVHIQTEKSRIPIVAAKSKSQLEMEDTTSTSKSS